MPILDRLKHLPLLLKIVIAIALGVLFGLFTPAAVIRIFVTINGIFGNLLSFAIPLIILGLVAPGIAELGKGAGKLLALTALIAYSSTLFAGFFSYFTCEWVFPKILHPTGALNTALSPDGSTVLGPYFEVGMPPVMDVMTALLLAFIVGLGLASVTGDYSRKMLSEFREVVVKLIGTVIIPFLPLYIFGIFLKMTAEGQVAAMMALFIKVIAVIFVMHVLLLLFQYAVAGAITGRNPLKLLYKMLPAYMTALGTQSSAATIPVTLRQTIGNGVKPELAGFVIPLCATIHLAGSILKIVACALAIMFMMGMPAPFSLIAGFIFLLGITMVAAPGVPGGAIMAALGLLQSMLGFDETLQGLMIALYITMDSFGTACNVTGDGAIALIINKIHGRVVERAAPEKAFPPASGASEAEKPE